MKKIFGLTITFLALCALIWFALTRPEDVHDVRLVVRDGLRVVFRFLAMVAEVLFDGPRALFVIALWIPLYWAYRENGKFDDKVSEKINALAGAGFDLVRLMETTTDGTVKRAGFLDDTAYRFAVTGPATIAAAFNGPATTAAPASGSPGFVSSNVIALPPDLAAKAHETAKNMMERRKDDIAAFSANTANVRNGLAVFLALMKYDNVQSAFFNMTEHMKKQRDDSKKKLPNFTELKVFFGLPIEWPEGGAPEKLQNAGLSSYESKAIAEALRKGKAKVLGGLLYNPPTKEGKPPIIIAGPNVLEAMRTFMHKADTYEPKLAPPPPPRPSIPPVRGLFANILRRVRRSFRRRPPRNTSGAAAAAE